MASSLLQAYLRSHQPTEENLSASGYDRWLERVCFDHVLETQKDLRQLGLYHGKLDSWFGPQTKAAMLELGRRLTAPTAATPRDSVVPVMIRARHFTRAGRDRVLWVVVHVMQTGEGPKTARSVAGGFAAENARQASAHYCVDALETIQCVDEVDVAWHAPGANRLGIGVEHAGRSEQSAAQWADEYSSRMLERSAALVARICKRWDIPVQRVGPSDLIAGRPGICGHHDCTLAWPEKSSGHWDPGPNFPWGEYLGRVAKHRELIG